MTMITLVDDYFALGCGRCERFATPECSTRAWKAGIDELRRICLETGLEETAKWGHPCYMHANRNIAIIGAMRGDFRLTFFNGSLLKDPYGALEKGGPQTKYPDMMRFVHHDDVVDKEHILRTYLVEAMSYAAQGIKPVKEESEIALPLELVEALANDEELATAFNKLTPGRQRSYVFHLETAKKSETRLARIKRVRPKILAGKGALER